LRISLARDHLLVENLVLEKIPAITPAEALVNSRESGGIRKQANTMKAGDVCSFDSTDRKTGGELERARGNVERN